VSTTVNDQISPALIPDGAGGVILTWYDYRVDGSFGDIYAQRINAFGVPAWAANGVAVCTATNHQAAPVIAPDGGTGAIIAWYDTRNGVDTDIFVQRVNASGVPQWAANGVALTNLADSQIFHDIVSDGAGGAIVVWEDHRPAGSIADIYAQRVNASGVPQWAANGVAVCAFAGSQYSPRIATDGAGGAIITWRDLRGASADIYAQRLNAAGVAQWTANGIALTSASGDQYYTSIASDGAGGAIVAWQDDRSAITDIYAQRVNGSGVLLWVANGAPVCTASDFQTNPAVASDGAGGAIITWSDSRNPPDDIYAQRLAAGGSPQWGYDGIPIAVASGYQMNPGIVSDAAGGAVIAWRDTRSGANTDVYAQRVSAFGITQWTLNGTQLTTLPAAVGMAGIVWDGSAAIVGMHDYRNGDSDIYAQRAEGRFGYWGHPEPVVTSVADVPKDQGGFVAVNWTASTRDVNNPRTVGYYTIWRAVNSLPFTYGEPDGARLVTDIRSVGPETRGKVVLAPPAAAPATEYYWELVGTQDAHGFAGYTFSAPTRADSVAGNAGTERFMVAAHDPGDDYLAFQSNTLTGHSVDNLAPAAPMLLTIARFGLNAILTWKPVGDPDFAHYTLYRASSGGVTPVPGNFLVDEGLTNHIDVGAAPLGYYYIVVAVDAHGNRSAPSNEVSLSGSTGVDGDTPPARLVVEANAPNPFAASSTFRLGLAHEGGVDVDVYDVAGRRVRSTRISGVKGWQEVRLDGRDDTGHVLASGVYFYRVSAAGQTITRKMVIAR
jgi:hypothetical protein